ncbi:MAG TPA: DUF1552 domain-containing protein [Polyangia bacterium]|nr:DUF1552 domain-containing protein [Polyangia bacterium]
MSRRSSTLRFSRRDLLKGLGAGTVILAPFVNHRASMAQAAPAGNLIIFFTPNGHKRSLTENNVTSVCFDATTSSGGTGTDMTLGKSLTPLAPLQSDVAVIKGLNLKSPTFIASHQDICRILTCQGMGGTETDKGQFTGYGPSIDQSVGMAFNQRPVVVAVDPYRDAPQWRTFLSWRSSGVNEPFTKDFSGTFTDLFGGLTGQAQTSDQMAALARARARNQSILDFVKGDISTFRSRINSNDRAHLDTYLDSLASIQQKVTQTTTIPGTCDASPLNTRITSVPPSNHVQPDDKSPDGLVDQMNTRGQLWMDMIATAFACGTRRVATIQWQGASEGYDVGANTGSPSHHSVSHYSFGAASGDRWVAIDTWYATQFAYQMNALKKLGVLDTTIIAWVSEITEGHNQSNMVTVVGGGKGLGMKLGQYIKYPFVGNEVEGANAIPNQQNPMNASLSDLWVTCQNALGISSKTFGDPKFCKGGLPELRAG